MFEFREVEVGHFRRLGRLSKREASNLVGGCPHCGSGDIVVWFENPHCWFCGGELVEAHPNSFYSRSELVCSRCGVVEDATHYIMHCNKCGKEFRIRVKDMVNQDWNFDDWDYVKNEPKSHSVTHPKANVVVCPNCHSVIEVKGKESICPHCGYLIPISKTKAKLSDNSFISRKSICNKLSSLLPLSIDTLLGSVGAVL